MQAVTFLRNPFVQICYHVPDVEIATRQMAETFGWGPFLREWYKMVRDAAENWHGADPVRILNEEDF